MAAIKSTLDLILEKTKHLSLNKDEKEVLKQQELADDVRRHVLPFLNEERELSAFQQWLTRLAPAQQDHARSICLDLFLGSLSPYHENGRVLSGVERILGETGRRAWEAALARRANNSAGLRQQALAEAEARFRELLASEGIRGSGLVPCTECTPAWKEEERRLIARFQEDLRAELNVDTSQR
ncbi:MAG: hypothetical protein AB1640_00790 [bacterium]